MMQNKQQTIYDLAIRKLFNKLNDQLLNVSDVMQLETQRVMNAVKAEIEKEANDGSKNNTLPKEAS